MARNLDLNSQLEEIPESVKFDSLNHHSIQLGKRDQSTDSINGEVSSDLNTTISSLTKDLRHSFTNGMSNVCESYVSNRLKSKIRNVARDGRKEEGIQAFRFSKYGSALEGFSFNSQIPYHDTFKARYFVKKGSNRGHLILHFPAFIPVQSLQSPKEATHFKLYNQLLALSDFEWNDESGYQPLTKKFHGKKSEFYSQMLPLLKIPTQAITAQLSVNNGMGVPDQSGLFLIMGVHFYRYQDGHYVPMSKESTLEITQVY